MSFTRDLEFGNEYEQELINHLNFDTYTIMKGYFPYYDVEVMKDGIKTCYEVKSDRYTYKTNNIVIEFEFKGQPSGISVTTADYYAYFVVKPDNTHDLYIIPTSVLREMIKNNKAKIITGGYCKASSLFVYNVNQLSNYKQ